jgi:hypothetical protein
MFYASLFTLHAQRPDRGGMYVDYTMHGRLFQQQQNKHPDIFRCLTPCPAETNEAL